MWLQQVVIGVGPGPLVGFQHDHTDLVDAVEVVFVVAFVEHLLQVAGCFIDVDEQRLPLVLLGAEHQQGIEHTRVPEKQAQDNQRGHQLAAEQFAVLPPQVHRSGQRQ